MRKQKEQKQCRYLASVGGQALMEGIMMNGPKGAAMALRMPDGSIEVTPKYPKKLAQKYKFARLPFIRGPISFVENMIFGYRCLMESAEKTSLELPDETEEMSKLDRWLSDHFGPKMMSVIGVISAVLGFALSFGLFIALPSYIFKGLQALTGLSIMWRPLIEGVIKIAIFVGYMAAVSCMKEMKRLFMYHGAEHKSIACLEAGDELTVENVRRHTRFHPRCGTSFLFVTILLSILLAAVMSVIFNGTAVTRITILWVLLKLLLIPIIMSIGYEFIRYAGKHDNLFVTICAAPGLWMQRITTKEPTDDIIEVGIASLKAVLDGEEENRDGTDGEENPADDAVPETDEADDETPVSADGESADAE